MESSEYLEELLRQFNLGKGASIAQIVEKYLEKTLQILDSKERIPYPSIHGAFLYNFWQDAEHQRGIWRRTTLAEYRKAEPSWELSLIHI